MENELVKVNPAEFGLQAQEAAAVEAVFLPMIEKMKELEAEYNEIMLLPIGPTTCKRAKELKNLYVHIRTETVRIHANAKSYYRKGGLFVDAWKNAQAFSSAGKEEKLDKIEHHFEILEAERKAKLKTERLELIAGLCEVPEMYLVQDMSEAAFKQLFGGLTLAKQQKEDAERQAEEERVLKEKIERLQTTRAAEIWPYYHFLENKNPELGVLTDVEYSNLLINLKERKKEYDAEQEKIRIDNERLKKEAQAVKEKAELERKKQEAVLAAERERAAKEKAVLEEKLRIKDRKDAQETELFVKNNFKQSTETIKSNCACDYCVMHNAPCSSRWCTSFKGREVIVAK